MINVLKIKRLLKKIYQKFLKKKTFSKYLLYRVFLLIQFRLMWKLRRNGYKDIKIEKKYLTNTDVLIIKLNNDNEKYICRFPITKEALIRCEINYETMKTINKYMKESYVPETILKIEMKPRPFFIESFIIGKDGTEFDFKDRELLINSAKEVLSKLKESLGTTGSNVKIDDYIKDRLSIINNIVDKKIIPIVFTNKNDDVEINITHGDFWLGNVIYGYKGKVNGIIDWERFSLDAPSFYDEYHMDLSSISEKKSCSIGESIIDFIKQEEVDPTYIYMYWLKFVADTLLTNSRLRNSKRWLNKNVYNVDNYYKKYYRVREMSVIYDHIS